MEARAIARYIRIAPRKVRLVVNLVRGKRTDEALAILRHTPRGASPVILKLLNSAIANAANNLDLDTSDLVISQIFVDEGPTMKRFHPRSQGKAYPILKRSSHITVVVKEKA